MKQPIKGKLNNINRVRVSGEYDDNVIQLKLRITEGPASLLDRNVTTDVGISDFVSALPVPVAQRLREELTSRLGEQ
jgi:hypothetical protein